MSMKMRSIIIIFVIKCIALLSSSFIIIDQCVSVCENAKLPRLDLDYYEQVVCQRGCRFFNIIKFKDDIKINTTKKECHISCDESYIIQKENEVCKTGCDLMAKEQEFVISTLLMEAESSIVLASPDRDIELDLLSDPSLKNQLDIGFNVDYKIPETRIRTMPIELTEEEFGTKETGDWLDCASRNSGIPKWILLIAILSAVLVALWLSFSTEKRSTQDELAAEIDIADDKLILDNMEILIEKDPALLETMPIFSIVDQSTDNPPEYTVESQKV